MLKSLNSSTLLTTSNLGHAYLIVGEPEDAELILHKLFSQEGVNLTGSPDYFVYKEPLFGVDMARELSASALRKAFTLRKVYFIAPEKITIEAQNALLKTFEEPVENTHFFIVARNEEFLIPTLRSRLETMRLSSKEGEASDAKKFLKLTLKERMSFVKKFVDSEKNVSVFLDELLGILRGSSSSEALERVYKARLISDARGASPRLILEHLSLVI